LSFLTSLFNKSFFTNPGTHEQHAAAVASSRQQGALLHVGRRPGIRFDYDVFSVANEPSIIQLAATDDDEELLYTRAASCSTRVKIYFSFLEHPTLKMFF